MAHRNTLQNAECECLPGTTENGWYEIRSERCKQDELDIWAEMMEKARNGHFDDLAQGLGDSAEN